MSRESHSRALLVALCLIVFIVFLESLLVRDISSLPCSRPNEEAGPNASICQRESSTSPAQLIDAAQIVVSHEHEVAAGVSMEPDKHLEVTLRTIINAPHSWDLIVKGPLYCQWLGLWALVSTTIVLGSVGHGVADLWTEGQDASFRIQFLTDLILCRANAALNMPAKLLSPGKITPLLASPSTRRLSPHAGGYVRGHRRSGSVRLSCDPRQ
ncbi:hypothetical protein HYDPIDRAFT_112648 [Hydnomerulius pinastri MD-312]|uniref:Uncharacterized protein n=1 Tax=Hydnomerulius pinastri MD-312 TaxID=994086 RepID=A0A0C9WEQ2_9AGAM|nr:hypothetical protein HYDPIDRAFT_112648 [Hydnomerulius pinastri MD-312]